jgi:hypothetical protein
VRCVAVPIAAGKALGAGNIENIAKTSNAASGDWNSNPQGKDNGEFRARQSNFTQSINSKPCFAARPVVRSALMK